MYDFLVESNERYGTSREMLCNATLGCSSEMIRENVIVAPWWEPDMLDGIEVEEEITIKGSVKVWNCILHGKKITYIKTGIGASVCTDVILALGSTECKRIIFIGSAGALDKRIEIGDIVIPSLSVCGDGVCRYLEIDLHKDCFGEKYYPDNKLNELLIEYTKRICKENGVNYHYTANFSVDTIFAQFAHLDTIRKYDCKTIEMETAAAFKAALICNISIAAIFSISDNAIKNKSLYSGRSEEEKQYRKKVRKEIIPQIINSVI